MEITDFKQIAEKILGDLEELVSTMPQKGDRASDCQKLTIQQAINELYACINGTEQADLIDEEEE